MDANEVFAQPHAPLSTSARSFTGRGECILQWLSDHNITLPFQDVCSPTHFPYNTTFRPRRLDYIASRHNTTQQGGVTECRHRASTDHDGVQLTIRLPSKGEVRREPMTWGPRKLKNPVTVEQHLLQPAPVAQDPHHSIALTAKAITRPGRTTNKYSESTELKHLRRCAQQASPGDARQAWKQVQKVKAAEKKQWLRQKAEEASQLSWAAFRSVQQHKQRKQGWQLPLLDPGDWEAQLRKHFKGIFNKVPTAAVEEGMQQIRRGLEHLCKRTPWRPFTPGEVNAAVARWAKNKSCGQDGISHEAMQAMLQHPQWEHIILSELHDMLYKGVIHSSVGKGLTVLLPKISEPTQWGDCRPITLSSTMLKLLAQLLLSRGRAQLQQGGRLQWSRTGRQGVELLAILRRVVRMAKDWGVATWIVKLDIQKAFDSVSQVSMAQLIARKVGGMDEEDQGDNHPDHNMAQPWEARLWTSLLQARSLHIATGDHVTFVEQTNGVRQGSPDSPVVFAALTAEALDKAVSQTAHMLGNARGPPPPEQGGAYMDDTYLWSHDKKHLQATLTALETQLASHGLAINPKKTAIIYSEDAGGGTFNIGGARVACLPYGSTITVLGSPLTFGEAIPNLVAEMQRRGRASFRQHRDILCARTDIRKRLTAYNALVRNAALWGGETWPVHDTLLKQANHMQMDHLRQMLHINKKPGEAWAEWNKRSLRQARVQLHKQRTTRWSSFTLERIWTFWGHLVRGGEEVQAMITWKDLTWWRRQQSMGNRGVKHRHRFNSNLDVERALSKTGGNEWMQNAQNRERWRSLTQAFVEQHDVPWATGRQPKLDNLTPTASASEEGWRGRLANDSFN